MWDVLDCVKPVLVGECKIRPDHNRCVLNTGIGVFIGYSSRYCEHCLSSIQNGVVKYKYLGLEYLCQETFMPVTGLRTNKENYVVGEEIFVQLDGTCGFGDNLFSLDIKNSRDQQNWTTFANYTEVMACVFTTTWSRDVGSMIAPSVIGDYYIGCSHTVGFGEVLFVKKINVRQPLPPNKGELYVKTAPSGANVFIDGVQQAGTTPFRKVLDAGAYTIKVNKEGYKTVEATVFLVPGEVTEMEVMLELGGDGVYGLIKYIPWIALAGGIIVAAKVGSDMIATRKKRGR